MAKKTKYDVLNKELNAVNKNILSLAFTAISLSRKLESDKYSEEEKGEIMSKMMKKFLPFIKIFAHIGYENCRDLKTLDEETINEYLASKKISKEDFLKNYEKKQNELIAMLTILAVAEKENVDIFSIENPLSFIDWFDGEFDGSILDELEESSFYDMLEEVFDDDFTASNMSNELQELIDNYHNNYMETVIYPKVSAEVKEKDILKVSKYYSKKSK